MLAGLDGGHAAEEELAGDEGEAGEEGDDGDAGAVVAGAAVAVVHADRLEVAVLLVPALGGDAAEDDDGKQL